MQKQRCKTSSWFSSSSSTELQICQSKTGEFSLSVKIGRSLDALMVLWGLRDLELWQTSSESFRINCGVDACECLVGVNNGEPRWSEITLSDTLTLGGQEPQIEMSAVCWGQALTMAAVWHTPSHGTLNTALLSGVTKQISSLVTLWQVREDFFIAAAQVLPQETLLVWVVSNLLSSYFTTKEKRQREVPEDLSWVTSYCCRWKHDSDFLFLQEHSVEV